PSDMSQRTERSRTGRAFLAAVALAVALLAPSTAFAEDSLPLSVDWDKLGLVLHPGGWSFLPHETVHGESVDPTHGEKPEAFLGMSPRLALVARDWGVSQVLWGHLGVTDQFRLSRSSRMVVTRVRLANGRLSPFAHVGVGQWRADTTVVQLPSDMELAGQLGGGFELEIAPRAILALEGDGTFLYREGRDPQALSCGQLWSTMLAATARF
ncbi:MAG TPA: hypothetical protein VHS09_11850, partial [Polyangiaceae bacterium]|nr:hypothetical protein [Polyangiaceae bacterium]